MANMDPESQLPKVILNDQEKAYYKDMFMQADTTRSGFITPTEALNFFSRSRLSQDVLRKIWDLVNRNGNNQLRANAFAYSLRLIALAQDGVAPSHRQYMSTQRFKLPVFQGVDISNYNAQAKAHAPELDSWIMTPSLREEYRRLWNSVYKSENTFLSGIEAQNYLKKSGLSPQDLGLIWRLSDIDKDGKLSFDEFTVCVLLIKKRLNGKNLPPALPPSLLDTYISEPRPVDLRNVQMPIQVLPSTDLSQLGAPIVSANPSKPVHSRNSSINTREWKLSNEERENFKNIFKKVNLANESKISGQTARELFMKSGLSNEDLSAIWRLADFNNDGGLNQSEFMLAMKLINHRREGGELPNELPFALKSAVGLIGDVSFRIDSNPPAPTPNMVNVPEPSRTNSLPAGMGNPVSRPNTAMPTPIPDMPNPTLNRHNTITNVAPTPVPSMLNPNPVASSPILNRHNTMPSMVPSENILNPLLTNPPPRVKPPESTHTPNLFGVGVQVEPQDPRKEQILHEHERRGLVDLHQKIIKRLRDKANIISQIRAQQMRNISIAGQISKAEIQVGRYKSFTKEMEIIIERKKIHINSMSNKRIIKQQQLDTLQEQISQFEAILIQKVGHVNDETLRYNTMLKQMEANRQAFTRQREEISRLQNELDKVKVESETIKIKAEADKARKEREEDERRRFREEQEEKEKLELEFQKKNLEREKQRAEESVNETNLYADDFGTAIGQKGEGVQALYFGSPYTDPGYFHQDEDFGLVLDLINPRLPDIQSSSSSIIEEEYSSSGDWNRPSGQPDSQWIQAHDGSSSYEDYYKEYDSSSEDYIKPESVDNENYFNDFSPPPMEDFGTPTKDNDPGFFVPDNTNTPVNEPSDFFVPTDNPPVNYDAPGFFKPEPVNEFAPVNDNNEPSDFFVPDSENNEPSDFFVPTDNPPVNYDAPGFFKPEPVNEFSPVNDNNEPAPSPDNDFGKTDFHVTSPDNDFEPSTHEDNDFFTPARDNDFEPAPHNDNDFFTPARDNDFEPAPSPNNDFPAADDGHDFFTPAPANEFEPAPSPNNDFPAADEHDFFTPAPANEFEPAPSPNNDFPAADEHDFFTPAPANDFEPAPSSNNDFEPAPSPNKEFPAADENDFFNPAPANDFEPAPSDKFDFYTPTDNDFFPVDTPAEGGLMDDIDKLFASSLETSQQLGKDLDTFDPFDEPLF
eukprot:TRINITY_DN1289_c0_g1_i1.p1 TRINITY_DN1289_c0_g1~~TRINITY_DN1289_c0_g1_i1.p1  ORF type:complete len:1199 (-),score=370.01 TRINITY_DN1289_c0_g1_i1:34-3630(-)